MGRRRKNSSERDFMIGNRYERILKLGEGTFGKVFKARDTLTGKIVALKKCRIEMDREGVPPTAIREVSLLKVLGRSNHVVKLLGAELVDEDGKAVLYLIFEHVQHDLKKFMGIDSKRQHLPLPQHLLKSFTFQLLRGVAFMHQHGIIHRDLKPQNLLVDPDAKVLKIADLGLGRVFSMPAKAFTHEMLIQPAEKGGKMHAQMPGEQHRNAGNPPCTHCTCYMLATNCKVLTLWYRAPEILLGSKHYALPVDVWSVGCILAEMAKGVPLFPSDCEFAQLLTVFQILGTPTEQTWPGVTMLKDWHAFPQWPPVSMHALMAGALDEGGVDLLLQMLRFDPDERITVLSPVRVELKARRALEHPWFDDLDVDAMDALENPAVVADALATELSDSHAGMPMET